MHLSLLQPHMNLDMSASLKQLCKKYRNHTECVTFTHVSSRPLQGLGEVIAEHKVIALHPPRVPRGSCGMSCLQHELTGLQGRCHRLKMSYDLHVVSRITLLVRGLPSVEMHNRVLYLFMITYVVSVGNSHTTVDCVGAITFTHQLLSLG